MPKLQRFVTEQLIHLHNSYLYRIVLLWIVATSSISGSFQLCSMEHFCFFLSSRLQNLFCPNSS